MIGGICASFFVCGGRLFCGAMSGVPGDGGGRWWRVMRGGWGGVACLAMREAGDAWWVVCNSVRCFLSLRKCLPDRSN